MIAFHLHTFMVRHNGGLNGRTMPIFCAFELILQIILVILTGVRAGFDGYGWSWVVCGINIFNVLFYYFDFFNFGFNSPLSLFFLLILESISLAANILVRVFAPLSASTGFITLALFRIFFGTKICFLGVWIMRATSMFVLALWFLQKGAFTAFLISTILRAIHEIEGASDDDDELSGVSYRRGGHALPQQSKSDDENESENDNLHNVFA